MTTDKLQVARSMLAEGRPKSTIAATIGVSRATLSAHPHRLPDDVDQLQPVIRKELHP